MRVGEYSLSPGASFGSEFGGCGLDPYILTHLALLLHFLTSPRWTWNFWWREEKWDGDGERGAGSGKKRCMRVNDFRVRC